MKHVYIVYVTYYVTYTVRISYIL